MSTLTKIDGFGYSKQKDDFLFSKENRRINMDAVSDISDTIRETGIIVPIFCYKNKDGKLEIIDGQHRFYAMITYFPNEEIPYTYTIDIKVAEAVKIQLLNSTNNAWKIVDFMRNRAYHYDEKCAVALELKGYKKATNKRSFEERLSVNDKAKRLNLAQVISILEGSFKSSAIWQKEFLHKPIDKSKVGTLTKSTVEVINTMADEILVNLFNGGNKTHITNGFVQFTVKHGLPTDFEKIVITLLDIKKGLYTDLITNEMFILPTDASTKKWYELFVSINDDSFFEKVK